MDHAKEQERWGVIIHEFARELGEQPGSGLEGLHRLGARAPPTLGDGIEVERPRVVWANLAHRGDRLLCLAQPPQFQQGTDAPDLGREQGGQPLGGPIEILQGRTGFTLGTGDHSLQIPGIAAVRGDRHGAPGCNGGGVGIALLQEDP